jgi:putative heme-binding domain-containing protein
MREWTIRTWLAWGLFTVTAMAGERAPWTTSRVVGTPDPPLPFRSERVFPRLHFEHPVLLAFAPGIDRMFVGEQAGKVWSFRLQDDVATRELAIDLKTAVSLPPGMRVDALYGLAFDPRFSENRYVYLCYVLAEGQKTDVPEGSRVSRFRLAEDDLPRIDAASETILLTFRAGGHNGGCLEFGKDGYLYISTGDATPPNPPDGLRTGQDCSDLLSSILRIDVHRSDGGRPYAIPDDNPFVDLPGVRPEIWAYGLRNPWKITFDRETGELWVADVGWDQWETVHYVTKGANFGWGAYEGRQPVLPDVPLGPTPIVPPLIELPHSISASVTGGYVYRGRKFPELRGEYVFGDWETKMVWGARRDDESRGSYRELAATDLQIVAFGEDHQGELYLADYGQGVIHTLVRNEQAHQASRFPRRLSETGLFDDVADEVPAAGVLPFEINQPQWTDFATARRWIALPGTASITWHPQDVPIPGSMFSRQHDFPAGTVLAKTLSLEMRHGQPESSRKIETQLLHFDGRNWRGYSYAWNDEQTDAELVPAEGAERTLVVDDPRWAGGRRVQRWTFISRVQCLSCHSPWAQHALAFQPLQLHRAIEVQGRLVNQLQWLEEQGVYRRVDSRGQPLPPFTPDTLAEMPRLPRQDDPSVAATQQARAYLHVNCSHCHRFNGGGAGSFELLWKLSDRDLQVLDALPRQGTFDIPEARLVAPGQPYRSLLYLRMAKQGRGRMPHLGSESVDEQGLAWIEAWIRELGDAGNETPSPLALDAWPGALHLARRVARGELPPDQRDRLLQLAADHPSALVRDLFAAYQPAERRRITLGNVIRPHTILSLTGNAERGARLFHEAPGVQCRNCHKLDQPQASVGPDLREVARKRSRQELLESLLEPSKHIERPYMTYIVQTTSGRVQTGLLVRENDREIVLRDTQAKDSVLLRADIELLQTSPKSLMPDALLRDLTAQEAADLLSFLESLKLLESLKP